MGVSPTASSQTLAVAISMTLLVTLLWMVTHQYQGFSRDGELYAFQALARVNTGLRGDVYLMDTSQDRYTCFSPLYAWFIRSFGLQQAALLLFVLCSAWFLAAAWALCRELFDRDAAWLAAAMLITTVGYYGAYGIFHYSESYLTARSLAEALVVTSLALHFRGRKVFGSAFAACALLVHPLMALPGILVLFCLSVPTRVSMLGTGLGLLATAGIAVAATVGQGWAGPFAVMDAPWLEVVRERSQFLFLNYWNLADWETHVRSLLCLTMSAMVIDDARIRRLCLSAAVVGGAGLVIAFIAGAVGPIAILLQGQTWRWFWITCFISVLLLAPTALRAWRDEKCGPICATLVISGWTFAAVDGTALIALAVMLWSMRSRIDVRTGQWLRLAAFALIAIIVAWALANCWSVATVPPVESRGEPLLLNRIRSIFGLRVVAVLFFGLAWYGITRSRSTWLPSLAAVLLAASTVLLSADSFERTGTSGSREEFENFAEWRSVIPPTGNVLLVPGMKSASFSWFTLRRPSYLSVDQSSGVVFSRATALEIRRRSDVLLPIMEPDWRILSQMKRKTHEKPSQDGARPLTAANLVAICGDPQLGFVVAKENLGFEPLRHTHGGPWKDWNLYDCRRVRSEAVAD